VTNQFVDSQIETFCFRNGLKLPYQIEPIHGGRNSQVFRLTKDDKKWILKKYFPPSGNKLDRLGTEFKFLFFLRSQGVTDVPEPLALDRELNCALYSFIPGQRLKVIKEKHIEQAANFIALINRFRKQPEALGLPLAADACLCWQDHINLTEFRIGRLTLMSPASALELDAYKFITKQLVPHWSLLKEKLLKDISFAVIKLPLQLEERILSPSDFGFHNTITREDRLSFVDFEYAGWDDPSKLICDFLCQPELPVTDKQGNYFKNKLLSSLSCSENINQRVEKLLPVHRLKWCCILLNEFISEDRKRRMHAGLKSKALLNEQLNKTKVYFNEHLEPLI